MPPCQLVVDTNVLKHASDKNYHKVTHCINLIDRLMASKECLCLDRGTDGHIYYEYIKHLPQGSHGFALLLKLVSQNRIIFLSRDIPEPVTRKINRTGIKTSDRIFVRIAYKTDRKILVTQEYEDFTEKVRGIFKKEIDVDVIEAGEFIQNY